MAEETQYTANTGLVLISTANGERDGTGTIAAVITGARNGTLIKTITVKAQGTTTHGMVRFFVYDGSNAQLLQEVEILPNTPSAVNPTYSITIPLDFVLKSGYSLRASTQNAESFYVIAEGVDFAYYASSVRPDTTQYYYGATHALISTANSNRDGSGTTGTVFTAGSSAGYKGASIETITIQGIVNTTPGMVRLFIKDSSNNKFLFKEVQVPGITKSSTGPAFEETIEFEDNFDLEAGYSILASTENAQSFQITVDGKNWNYPA